MSAETRNREGDTTGSPHGPISPGQPVRKGLELHPQPRRHGWEMRGGSSAPRVGRGREVAECAGS